jgi:hypothetical protein
VTTLLATTPRKTKVPTPAKRMLAVRADMREVLVWSEVRREAWSEAKGMSHPVYCRERQPRKKKSGKKGRKAHLGQAKEESKSSE